MKHALTLTLLLTLGILGHAAPLTPREALGRAVAGTTGLPRACASLKGEAPADAAMQLAHTLNDPTSGAATVYIFTTADGSEGFIITAADDAAGEVLLGYSDTGTINAADLPPAMAWWLEEYSQQVAIAAAAPQGAYAPVRRKMRPAIEPLCTTKWNQGAPYNAQCPMVNGGRSVTGCVATAMAQVMKRWNWPITGEGEHAYYFDSGNSDSFDFGATTFDWANMLDSYSNGYDLAQTRAVATLMHACGVAAEMNYSPSSSGAQGAVAAYGMVHFLGYDGSMQMAQRNWYTTAAWNDLVYAELADGRPIYYQGFSPTAGHAFVCDGYSTNEYFHFNWGWGGNSDGYFLLSVLNPGGRGIGGGTAGSTGYTSHCGILTGVQPRLAGQDNVLIPLMACEGALGVDAETYTPADTITFIATGGYEGFYNMGLTPARFTLGARCVLPDGTSVNIPSSTADYYRQLWGEYGFSIPASALPVGSYYVYPSYCDDVTNQWHDMPVNVTLGPVCMHADVTHEGVTITPGYYAEGIAARIATWRPEYDRDEGFYPGHEYVFSVSLSSYARVTGTFALRIVDPATGEAVSCSSARTLSFGAPGYSTQSNFTILLPDDLPLGIYHAVIEMTNTAGITEDIGIDSEIEVVKAPLQVRSNVTAVCADGLQEGYLFVGASHTVTFDLKTNGIWSADVECRLLSRNGTRYSTVAIGDKHNVSLSPGTTSHTFTIDIPESVALGRYYLGLVYPDGQFLGIVDYPSAVTVTDLTSIEAVRMSLEELPANTPVYDLTGRRVAAPSKGVVYIVNNRKVIF